MQTDTDTEAKERDGAWERGRVRSKPDSVEGRAARAAQESVRRANPAFTALADNVRDYAIFLLDPNGVIVYWGEGARLMKWWTAQEAEGGHLRMLYPTGGSEDGTAEAHLSEASEQGEYIGEGQRVRADKSTFWAHVTLTALRDAQGTLSGFAKVTRDVQVLRAREAAVAQANSALNARDAALDQAREARTDLENLREETAFARERASGERDYLSHMARLEKEEPAETPPSVSTAADAPQPDA